MNANSKLLAPTSHKQWLSFATSELEAAGIPTARLDAELMLSFVTQHSRTYLIAHDEELINPHMLEAVNDMLADRIQRIPLAYLFAHKEFYGRYIWVTPDVLIPRPETETLIDLVKELASDIVVTILDVGTGSGVIAITIAHELSNAKVSACDISKAALKIAMINGQDHQNQVTFFESDLLSNANETYDIIVANLPYVDRNWERSPETDHEPALALFADKGGLALINRCIEQSTDKLPNGGYLVLEADPDQHSDIIKYAEKNLFNHIETRDYIVVLQKI